MAEQIKKHWDLSLLMAAGLILFVVGVTSFLAFPQLTFGDVERTIEVTATVEEYLTFTTSATSATIAPSLVDNAGGVHIGSSSVITLTLNTSSADGYSIDIRTDNDNGLISGANSIQTYAATATLVAGTKGYGSQGTSSDMTVNPRYKWATSTTDIGSASTSVGVEWATDGSAGANQIAYIRFLAAASSTQPSGSYVSTVTLTAIATP